MEATDEAGMKDLALGFGFAVRAADVDDDGDLDVYVANDSDPNYLYFNDGSGHFREGGVPSFAAFDANGAAQASMGIAMGDVDEDGILDMFVTNFSEDFSTLYKGLGDGFFSDVSRETGVGPITYKPLSWGTAFADLDNDGDLDLVVANGHIYPQIDEHPDVIGTYRQRSLLLENRSVGDDGPPRAPAETLFRDATQEAGPGFDEVRAHRGLAVGDFDNDGRLDILITAPRRAPGAAPQRGGPWFLADGRLRDARGLRDPDRDQGDGHRGRPEDDARRRRRGFLRQQPRSAAALRPGTRGDRRRGARALARRLALGPHERPGAPVPGRQEG